tara:strand:- start:207 stop:500 length:294 start_codon:yes stop_codon:yes gene_type:complete
MYGTIFKMKVKPGHEDQLLTILDSSETQPDGGVAWFLMNPDSESEWIGVAVFDSKESYLANANNPKQHEMFLKMMEHLESEPTWTDGEYLIGQTING